MASTNTVQPMTNVAVRNFSELCRDATHTASRAGFQAVLFLAIFECVVASGLNIYLMYTIWKVTVFHANLRWLLFHHSFNLVWFALGNGAKAAYILCVWFVIGEPCRLVTSLFDCKIQELIFTIPLVNGIYSLIVLCLERAYATARYRTYDYASATPWLAFVLIPCVWLIVLLNQCMPLVVIPRNAYMPICSNLLTVRPSVVLSILVPNMSVEVVAVVLASALYLINDRLLGQSTINTAKHTLAARFQVSQNVTVNRLLLPTVVCHAACFVFQATYLILVLTGLNLDESTKILLLHVNFVFLLLYAIVHPILAFVQNPHLRKFCPSFFSKCMRNAKSCKSTVAVQQGAVLSLVQSNVHFKTLEKIWSEAEPRKAKRRP